MTPGSKYGFYTTASNSIGESDRSQEVRFAAAERPGKPSSIRRHPDTSMTQLKVEWDVELDNDVPITGYILEADINQNGEFEEIWNG